MCLFFFCFFFYQMSVKLNHSYLKFLNKILFVKKFIKLPLLRSSVLQLFLLNKLVTMNCLINKWKDISAIPKSTIDGLKRKIWERKFVGETLFQERYIFVTVSDSPEVSRRCSLLKLFISAVITVYFLDWKR